MDERSGRSDAVDVAVVGAGLAGLVAAVTAARGGATVALFDAGRAGGRARATTVDPGVVFNAGPRALYVGGSAAATLGELGVGWRGAAPGTERSRALVDGTAHTMPGTAGQLLRTGLLGARSKVQVGWLLGTIARRDPARVVGRSVAEWIDGLGLRPDAAALLGAVVRLTTYVDDPALLDAGAALAQVQLALGSGVQYLDRGWQPLVDQLREAAVAAGVEVHEHRSVSALRPAGGDGGWVLDAAGTSTVAGSVVLAAGTPAAAAGLSPVPLALDGVGDPVTAACLELAVRGEPATRFLLGIDRPLYFSQHAPPAKLAPDGIGVVHVLRYGATSADADRAELWQHAVAAGVRRDDVLAERFLRRMVVSGGAPMAATGGLAGRPPVSVAGADGLFLAGDWVGDHGLLADAAVASGRTAGALAAASRATTRRSAPLGAVGTGWAP